MSTWGKRLRDMLFEEESAMINKKPIPQLSVPKKINSAVQNKKEQPVANNPQATPASATKGKGNQFVGLNREQMIDILDNVLESKTEFPALFEFVQTMETMKEFIKDPATLVAASIKNANNKGFTEQNILSEIEKVFESLSGQNTEFSAYIGSRRQELDSTYKTELTNLDTNISEKRALQQKLDAEITELEKKRRNIFQLEQTESSALQNIESDFSAAIAQVRRAVESVKNKIEQGSKQ